MKYIHLTIFLLFITKSTFSQKCFIVCDSVSKTKIQYANIWKENKIYTNSDFDGKFCIRNNELNSKYKISYIGYKTSYLNLSNDSIFLSKSNIILNEVIITTPLQKKILKFGNCKESDIALSAKNDLKIAEIGRVFILNDSIEHFFSKLKLNTFSSSKNRVIGIKIYSLDKNNEPKDQLTDENIICNVEKGNSITSIDLSKLKISVPKNGFFISIQIMLLEVNKQYGENNKEWFFYEPSIGAKKDISNSCYYSLTEQNVWEKHKNCELSFEVEISD